MPNAAAPSQPKGFWGKVDILTKVFSGVEVQASDWSSGGMDQVRAGQLSKCAVAEARSPKSEVRKENSMKTQSPAAQREQDSDERE
jgi:hypothetical protein